jgi:hypothetical protein
MTKNENNPADDTKKNRWTTQKTFHALNFSCAMCRALVFAFRDALDAYVVGTKEKDFKDDSHFSYAAAARSVTRDVAFDLPCALFLTTYALLVLFWAEIYRQARPGARDRDPRQKSAPRRVFFFGNLALYVVLAALWGAGGVAAGRANFMTDSSLNPHSRTRRTLEACAAGALALCACVLAALFAKYGGSLFFTLRRFPERLKGRRKKLREVGTVTAVCALCFSARAAVAAAEAVALGRRGGSGGFLDAAHPATPAADVVYYAACELLPAATALVVLRKLPPKKTPRAESADRGDENV